MWLDHRNPGAPHPCHRLGEYGRLGHGSEHSLSRPTLVESLVGERITQIAAGQAHSVAVSWKGEAFTWGYGFQHVLGHGGEGDRLEPTRLSIPSACGEPKLRGSVTVAAGVGCFSDGGGGTEVSARGSGEVAAAVGVDDGVTCAAAGTWCTVLGTRRGRVLFTGMIVGSTIASGRPPRGFRSPTVSEFGRVDGGCWRVQCSPILDIQAETVLAIDYAGQAHELHGGGSPWGPHRRKKQKVASGGGSGSGGGSSSGGVGARVEPDISPSVDPPPRQLRVAPPFAKCSSVLITPAVEDTCLSWAEDGNRGRGNAEKYVAVASDGRLVSSFRTGETVELQRGAGDGVVHASAWASFHGDRAHGLLLVDGGASVVTQGNGRTGHVSSKGRPLLVLAAAVWCVYVVGCAPG